MIEIRAERPDDVEAIHRANVRAFGRESEAMLVDRLRAAGKAVVSLVAVQGGDIVGHILFSPVTVERAPVGFRAAGLAPMCVVPELQKLGIGSGLVRAGLDACRRVGYDVVVVLGDPPYYSRFGFVRAGERGLGNEYDADDAFMVTTPAEGALTGASGLVRYAPEFAEDGC